MKKKRNKKLVLFTYIIFIILFSGIFYGYLNFDIVQSYLKYVLPVFIILLTLLLIPKSWIINNRRLFLMSKMLVYFIFFSFFIIYIGKSFFVNGTLLILYLYGISVTYILLIIFYVAIFKYEDPYILAKQIIRERRDKGIKINKPLVSCIVAVYNEEDLIKGCIESMINQTYTNLEIIYVNDNSTDKTLSILNKYKKQGKIKVIDLKENVGKKKAIAEGIRISKGELIAMSDSDSVWNDNVIKRIVAIFNTFEDVGGVSGHGRALNASKNIYTKIQDSWYEGQFSIRKAFESVYGSITCISGPLAVFRREAIYNYIPAWINDTFLGQEFKFATDRTLTGYVLGSGEIGKRLKEKYKDSEFVKSINYDDREWDVVYSKGAKSRTNVPDTFSKIIQQQIRWKKSFIRNIFFTGAFYWKRPTLPSIFYYLHVLYVIVGPIISFRHLIYFPIKGELLSPVYYLVGIFYVGSLFGIAVKLEDKHSKIWVYRPLMSLLSTLVISWLIFYSIFTIKKMVWTRN